jgi:galactokinase
MTERLSVSAPGRICLFGEHQDYLGLDVVAAAIGLRVRFDGTLRSDRTFVIELPDVGRREEFRADGELPYADRRDYLRSGLNVLRRSGTPVPSGWDVIVRGTIPINAGTASSSALVVAWDRFLLEAGRDPRASSPIDLAELAYTTEVAEFGEPGGRMDHYAAAFGGVIRLEAGPPSRVTLLDVPLGDFVLGDSLEKKDTTGTLRSVKDRVLDGLARVRRSRPGFSLRAPWTEELDRVLDGLEPAVRSPLRGAFVNRDLTAAGLAALGRRPFDDAVFGSLLVLEQAVLRDALGVSTPKLDRMLDAALDAGALGGKLNGSGGGGCMFAYAPGRAGETAAAVEKAGGKAYIIRVDEGARVEY